jgi:fumarate hydratase subunit alpha
MTANFELGADVRNAMQAAIGAEDALGAQVLATLVENTDLARSEQAALCQDTGMAVVFIEIGRAGISTTR